MTPQPKCRPLPASFNPTKPLPPLARHFLVLLFSLFTSLTLITSPTYAEEKNKAGDNSGWAASIAEGEDDGTLTEQQKNVIVKINQYLNSLTGLKGRFIQINPDDEKQKGKFFLKRPGRIRFDYAAPSLQKVIADGKYLSIEDRDINTVDRYPLEKTPFRILLADDVNLVRDAFIKSIVETDEFTSIILIDRKGAALGQIELVFTNSPVFQLSEWKVIDTQGQTTRVVLTNLKIDEKIDGKLFKLENFTTSIFGP